MELSKAIRTGYFDALNGAVLHNGQAVPVFDAFALPNEVDYPYVLISSQSSVQRSVKRCKVYDLSIVIDIVTGSSGVIGMSQAEDIAEEIENIINPDTFEDIDIRANGYKIGDTRRIADNQITTKNEVNYIFRKLITYSHLIHKI